MRNRFVSSSLLFSALSIAFASVVYTAVEAKGAEHQALAFYYGWYGTPAVSGDWVHWKGIDAANRRIDNSADFPPSGPYDSHDPLLVDRQVAEAHAAGVSGFIASWWGQGSFEDRGMPLLLDAAARHGLAVSAYYEILGGRGATHPLSEDRSSRIRTATAELLYLLREYGSHKAWLRVDGKPVIFVYGRALRELSPEEWREVVLEGLRGYQTGFALIADSSEARYLGAFNGTSRYNITGQTQHKTPPQIRDWAHTAYPKMVAAAGPGKISTVTVIPGYDDTKLGRPPPRPVTERWGGETYRVLWEEAIAAHPDYVLITSWNEWHEGSEIEPSVEYGSLFLDETARFARPFLAGRK